MPRPRVLEGRLVKVVIDQIIGRQDDEVDGTRELDVTKGFCQRTTIDRPEASRLVVHLDGRSDEVACWHRGPGEINEREDQPDGNEDHHDDAQQDPAHPSQRALHVSRRHMSAFLVSRFGRHRSHASTVSR